jgi:hypothetical protein
MNALKQKFEIASGVWRICEAPGSRRIAPVEPCAPAPEVCDVHLSFAVSSDEEHVQIHMLVGGQVFDMGCRAHNYLLLTLARRRIEDRARGNLETACGWLCPDDVAHDPMMAPPRLNIDVFRIRKQFAARGIARAEAIIERRPRARQLRIGTGHLAVVRV